MGGRGNEFGAATGRPRRCGWFDSVMARYAVFINGIKELAIMKMDVLDGLKKIEICVAYKYKGKKFREFPDDWEVLTRAKPVYKSVPGWEKAPGRSQGFARLHPNAKSYLRRLEDLLGAKISMVSVGSSRAETIII